MVKEISQGAIGAPLPSEGGGHHWYTWHIVEGVRFRVGYCCQYFRNHCLPTHQVRKYAQSENHVSTTQVPR